MNIAALSYNIKKPPKGGGTFRRPGTEDRSDPILWQQKIDSKRIKIFCIQEIYHILEKEARRFIVFL